MKLNADFVTCVCLHRDGHREI